MGRQRDRNRMAAVMASARERETAPRTSRATPANPDHQAVTNGAALGRLTPAAAATYLIRTGWSRMGVRNAGTVWTRPFDGGASHPFQPEDPASPDYALRVGEMLAALAAAEGRDEPAILADLCGGEPMETERGPARRTDWMEPEYGLRRPELALVLDLSACRVERHAFVLELERLDWPLSEAAELADLVAECELTAAESARAEGETRG